MTGFRQGHRAPAKRYSWLRTAMHFIPQDLTDQDLYKFSMGQMAFMQFPLPIAHYRYQNRDPAKRFRPGFADEVREQVRGMADLRLTPELFAFFQTQCPWLKPTYLQWLRQFRFNPAQVQAAQDASGRLAIDIVGPWFETIYWEVPLLFIVSELDSLDPATGRLKAKAPDWRDRIRHKAERMAAAGVNWIDFGARRRFDFATEDAVCEIMKDYAPFFRGTSNPYLAWKHGIKPFGTYAHEVVMAMQAIYGPWMCNEKAMAHWVREYQGDLGIALTDTLTTEVFLRSFGTFYAKLFDGVRLDSGRMEEIGDRMIRHYESLHIDPASKLLAFSGDLTDERAVDLAAYFRGRIKTTLGIGTSLTNDVGYPAPNQVIKLAAMDAGFGFTDVVKFSDSTGKTTGSSQAIRDVLRVLKIE